ncbi:mCG146411 [Mus musculus]|nr:mCG146411 [Mus musculus]
MASGFPAEAEARERREDTTEGFRNKGLRKNGLPLLRAPHIPRPLHLPVCNPDQNLLSSLDHSRIPLLALLKLFGIKLKLLNVPRHTPSRDAGSNPNLPTPEPTMCLSHTPPSTPLPSPF